MKFERFCANCNKEILSTDTFWCQNDTSWKETKFFCWECGDQERLNIPVAEFTYMIDDLNVVSEEI